RRAVDGLVGVRELRVQLVDLRPVRGDFGLGGLPLRLELRELVLVDALRRLLALRLRHLVLELREAPLRALPLSVEVVPHHPDDRQEQEDAGRREDDVQEIDVVCVPDALFFSHDQMLKKISGIATTYFRLKIHRASILSGSDIMLRNRNTVT